MRTKFFLLIILVNFTTSMDEGLSKNTEKWELSVVTEQKGKVISTPLKMNIPAEKTVPIPTKNSKIKCAVERTKMIEWRQIVCDNDKVFFSLSCDDYKEHSFTLVGSEDTRYLVNLKCST